MLNMWILVSSTGKVSDCWIRDMRKLSKKKKIVKLISMEKINVCKFQLTQLVISSFSTKKEKKVISCHRATRDLEITPPTLKKIIWCLDLMINSNYHKMNVIGWNYIVFIKKEKTNVFF